MKAQMSTNTCKICLDSESYPVSDPLISPCQCKGSVKYVHRACLAMWRAQQQQQGIAAAAYACEICGYRYKFQRSWWAHVIAHQATAMVCTLGLVTGLSWLLGFVNVLQRINIAPLNAYNSSWWMHSVNGLIVTGVIGAVLLLIEIVLTTPMSSRQSQTYPSSRTSDCCVCVGNDSCTQGQVEGCLIGCLAVVVLAGIAYIFYTFYGFWFTFVRARLEAVTHMVENVQDVD